MKCEVCDHESRNQCRCPQYCADCGDTVFLGEEFDWPETATRCWGCLDKRVVKLQTAIDEIETERERLEQMYAEFPGSMDHYAAETILDALNGLKE